MITQHQAEKLVYDKINLPWTEWPDKPEMIVVRTEERKFGWVVYWTSRLWYETKEFRYAIAGNGPYLVSREDGSFFQAGTIPPLEDRIREAESLLQEHLKSKATK